MSPDSPSLKRILLTNDDGWDSPGLAALGAVIRDMGELIVVAPREERSAIGHAITLGGTVRAEPAAFPGAGAAFIVDGTPADCAKLAVRALFARHPPDLCVSGLNHGPNVGVNVFYSGTVGAALEAVVNGVPAVAVSQDCGDALTPEEAARLVAPIIAKILGHGLPPWHALNVNVPNRSPSEVRGIRVTRQGVSGFDESYREHECEGSSPERLFSLEGEMCLREPDGMTDAEALAEGWVSVTPMVLDLTAMDARGGASGWGWLAGVPIARRP